ncbi:CPBP family intramembrane glutamic endopeptidase [Natrinema longum]|uniref:CPBP family intramembrane metalloprotease n=1 Tax=Natrinema longum TaxID=370324 RepID=A0A8A2UBZ0_9EURY|nr:type II CAAX endopeptidase family protein [Natrinema longum]MBZ6495892.1 CPBP family intramembrane metalloprotease [Natrinema longum]QSW86167.1 CPBP family intramembrane metalloprotease [Natrinema longum]
MTGSKPIELAAVVVAGWIVLEVALRRGLVSAAGAVGVDPLLADYLVLAIGFPLVAAILSWYALRQGQPREAWDWNWNLRALGVGLLAAVVGYGLSVGAGQLDTALFGLGDASGAIGESLTDAFEATPALALLFLVGNGIVVPISEEQVWRGIVQTELVDDWGVPAGIGVTAVLFALKHVLVDLSVIRLTTLLTLGLVFGVVRHRWGTASSTVTHVLINTVSSASLVALALL